MSAPLNWTGLSGIEAETECVTLEATVVTGFEHAAKSEALEKLNVKSVSVERGRILFDIPVDEVKNALKLRCVDNVYVILGVFPVFDFKAETDECLDRLIKTVPGLNWAKSLRAWNQVFAFDGPVYELDEAKRAKLENVPKFRCTCYRSGDNHGFSSMDAAKHVGGAIQDLFKWKVQMKDYDIEVVLNIDINQVQSIRSTVPELQD